jgi:hypothetical protein
MRRIGGSREMDSRCSQPLHGRRQETRLENEIAAKQDYLAALKAKIGVEEWCDLYRVEMSEADMMVNLLTEHPELRGH